MEGRRGRRRRRRSAIVGELAVVVGRLLKVGGDGEETGVTWECLTVTDVKKVEILRKGNYNVLFLLF